MLSGFCLKIGFITTGILASAWILLRLIPKPSRANYPCIKVAFPVATSFILYISGLVSSVMLFKKAKLKVSHRHFFPALVFFALAVTSLGVSLLHKEETLSASIKENNKFSDPLGPNSPIGEAKGIFPGRVVWVHNPDATNENCTNASQKDAYFLEKNTDQAVTDAMFSEGIQRLSGKTSDAEAWDAIFRHFNVSHNKGDIGYQDSETIFIKINAVTAYNGATPNGDMGPSIPVEYDTSPQAILTLLRQLIITAGVPQEKIYIGDPIADIWNHMYKKFYAEFPDVNYVSKRNIPGRYKLRANTNPSIYYSDKGKVITQLRSHKLFKEMTDANYLINVPTMKGHRWGGVTFFAKNHFGSNTSDGSWQLHKGLMDDNDDYDEAGRRYDYRSYRVLVDLMGSKYLGRNTLLFYMDALWATSHEHQQPQKFITEPFNNDWCSSFFLSLDPVAIESVCLDMLQKEFSEEDLNSTPPRYAFVMWKGVDDHLHQAASSDWWPEGITYDPDNSGTPIGSLGVHEHWNNPNEMKYSRNLGTGEGIELLQVEQQGSVGFTRYKKEAQELIIYPNPVENATVLTLEDIEQTGTVSIYSISGERISTIQLQPELQQQIDLSHLSPGTYLLQAGQEGKTNSVRFQKK